MVCVALQQWGHGVPGHGRRRHVADFLWPAPNRKQRYASEECNSRRNRVRFVGASRRMAFRTAWNLEDPRSPGLVLWNIGAAVLAFTLLYWICDRRGETAWASLVRPAGSNTLLTYLLPDVWYFLMGTVGVTWFDTHYAFGWAGVIKSVIFTLLMLVIASMLTRARVRLQL